MATNSNQPSTTWPQRVVIVHHWSKDRPAIVLADEGSQLLLLIAGSSTPHHPETALLAVTEPKLLKRMGLHLPTYFSAAGVTRKKVSELVGSPIGRCTPTELDILIDGSRAEMEAERRRAEMPLQRPVSGPRSVDSQAAKKRRP